MKYLAKKVEVINIKTKYEVGIDEIETIEIDSAEKVIMLTYKDNTRKLILIPYEGPIEITRLKEMKGATVY